MFAQEVEGREHHASWYQTLQHPDAEFIAAIDPQTVLALITHISLVEAELNEAQRELQHIYDYELGLRSYL